MNHAHVIERYKLVVYLILAGIFGVIVGGQAKRWRGHRR